MLLFSLLFTSCQSNKVWDIEKSIIIEKIAQKDKDIFETIPKKRYKEVRKLGDGSFLLFAKIFENLGLNNNALEFYKLGTKYEKNFYKEICIKESEKQEQQKQAKLDYENFVNNEVFFTKETSEKIKKAKKHLDDKYYSGAWEIYKELLLLDNKNIFNRKILSDAGKSVLYGGNLNDIEFLEKLKIPSGLLEKDKNEALFLITFYKARLSQRQNLKDTNKLFLKAMDYSINNLDYDTALWYLLDLYRNNDKMFLSTLNEFSKTWNSQTWFSNIIDDFIVKSVQNKNWENLELLLTAIENYCDLDTRARLYYLCGLTKGKNSKLELSSKELLKKAYEDDHDSLYYRVLSAYELNIPIAENETLLTKEEKKDLSKVEFNLSEGFIDSFLEWEIPRELLGIFNHFDMIPENVILTTADKLTKLDEHEIALRVAVIGLKKSNTISDELLKRLYPRPYLDLVEKYSKEYNLPESVLYGLIRTESFFNPKVSSWAGAKGLCQLMDGTASDIARKLKLKEYDVLDPETNIRFGAFYLAELIGRLDGSQIEALFSYNAGITRLRSWKKTYGSLSPTLFLEALPFAETRGYGRKVLAASSVYGFLYQEKTIEQTIQDVFNLD